MLRKKLYEIADIRAGGTPSRNNPDYWNGNIPWVKISNINGKYVTTYDETITELGLKNSSAKLFEKETILYTIFATLGRVGILQFDATTNQAIAGIKIKDNSISTDYLYYYLRSLESYVKDIGNGAAQQNINQTILKNFAVPVISKEKQNQICSKLENIENVLLKKQHDLASLDELIKSRFIEMFENKGFELLPIKELVDIKKISAKKKFNSDEAIKYIDISSIDNERNVIKGYTNYLMKDAPSRAQQCLKKNDILISTVRPNLKNIAIFKDDDLYYVGSSGFCILRAKNVNSDYLKYVVLDDKFTNAMADLTTGASYPAIRDDDVLNYLMINAPIELQNKFADFVQQIDKSKFIVQKEIKDLQELLDKKMDEYFGQ